MNEFPNNEPPEDDEAEGHLGLKVRAARGFAWVSAFTIIARGTQSIAILVLAKLLTPEEFGFFGLALPLINALMMFREMGLTPALIQRKEGIGRVFGVSLILLPLYGLVLYVIVFFAAIPFSILVKQPDVVPLVRVLGIIIPISSLGILPAAWFQRQIDFKRKAVPEIISEITGAFITILLAVFEWGVWSLIWGRIITEILKTILYWISSGFRWTPNWNTEEVKKLFKFGSTISLGSVADTLYFIIDRIIIGRFVGVIANGFYTFSFRIATLPVPNLTTKLAQVMLPVMSRLQDDESGLKSAVIKNISLNAFLAVPFCAGIFMFGAEFLDLLYGDKWNDAIPVMKVLVFYCFFWAMISPINNVFIAKGKPSYFFRISVLKLSIVIIGVVIVNEFFARTTVLYTHLFTWVSLVCYIYGYSICSRILGTSILNLFKPILPYIFSVVIGWLVLVASIDLIDVPFTRNLFLRILLFYLTYFLFLYVFIKRSIFEILSILKKRTPLEN